MGMDDMKVFHGRDIRIEKIELSKSGAFKDFGRGFYVTDIRKHAHRRAIDVAAENETKPVVTTFNYLEAYPVTWNPKDSQYGYAWKDRNIYIFLLNGFKDSCMIIPALNEGQKVVRTYSVTDNQTVSFRLNNLGETVLGNFKQTDKDVTIFAVELNKEVMDESKYRH
jgi:hypothetical protein